MPAMFEENNEIEALITVLSYALYLIKQMCFLYRFCFDRNKEHIIKQVLGVVLSR